jgi:hypothetical protein
MQQFNFICENGHDNYFEDRINPPVSCNTCSVAFEEERVVEVKPELNREIAGLSLICQMNQQRISIPVSQKVLLGRSHTGADLFDRILFHGEPVISRKHCSIEFTDDKFFLKDEESRNGTFILSSGQKISCKESPQIINDQSIVILGEELFLAQVDYKVQDPMNSQQQELQVNKSVNVKGFKCKRCGLFSKEKTAKCLGCGFKNTFIEVYE